MSNTELDPPVRRSKTKTRPRMITIRMTDEGVAALDALAQKEDRTRADMIRILLKRGLDASR